MSRPFGKKHTDTVSRVIEKCHADVLELFTSVVPREGRHLCIPKFFAKDGLERRLGCLLRKTKSRTVKVTLGLVTHFYPCGCFAKRLTSSNVQQEGSHHTPFVSKAPQFPYHSFRCFCQFTPILREHFQQQLPIIFQMQVHPS